MLWSQTKTLKNKTKNEGNNDGTNKEWVSIRANKNEEQEDIGYRQLNYKSLNIHLLNKRTAKVVLFNCLDHLWI